MSWVIGIFIAVISAIIIAAIVINLIPAKPEKLQISCIKLDSPINYNLANSSNLFDLRLLDQVLKTYNGKNVILSSFSVISVLSLVLLGAKGHTKEELATVLALPCHENISDAQNLYLNGYKSTHENLKVQQFKSCYEYFRVSYFNITRVDSKMIK